MLTKLTKLIALSTLSLVAVSSLSAKSTIGGIVFVNTYVSDTSIKTQDDPTQIVNNHDVTKFNVVVPNNSRLRVRWDNEDKVGMYLEVGLGSSSSLSLRHGYGKWDISEKWQILAGHTSTPFAPLNPQVAMVHNSGDGFGNVNPSRQAQLRFTYKFLNKQGALAVAFLDPNAGETYDDGLTSSNDKLQNASSFPRIDVGAVYKTFNIQVFPGAFYSRAAFEYGLNDVDVWGASLGLRTAIGPVTLSMEAAGGQNWGNTKMSDTKTIHNNTTTVSPYVTTSRTAAVFNGTTDLVDNNILKTWIDLGYRFAGDTLKGEVHIIGGYDKTDANEAGVDQEYINTMIGVSAPFDMPWIARGFRLRPELFYFDESQVDNQRGNATRTELIAGVQVQFTF